MKKLVIGEDHERAGEVIHLWREPRSLTAASPDALEFVTLTWSSEDKQWRVYQGSSEQMPGNQLYFSDNLGQAFCVFRAYLRSVHPYKRNAPLLA
jgi:hypothetical protein